MRFSKIIGIAVLFVGLMAASAISAGAGIVSEGKFDLWFVPHPAGTMELAGHFADFGACNESMVRSNGNLINRGIGQFRCFWAEESWEQQRLRALGIVPKPKPNTDI